MLKLSMFLFVTANFLFKQKLLECLHVIVIGNLLSDSGAGSSLRTE